MPVTTIHPHDNARIAVLAIMLSVMSLSLGDAIIKLLSVDFSLWQIYVVRSALALPILVAILRIHNKGLSLLPASLGWTALRSLLLGVMWIAYYAALPHIKLSVAAAVYYTIPLFITLFSALFTGDRVRPGAWFAILLGFAGVLLIVRPDSGGFNGYVLLPLIAAVLYALAMILTRTRCRHEDPGVLSLSLNVTFILIGVVASVFLALWNPGEAATAANPFLLGEWSALDGRGLLTLCILAVVVIVGSLFAAIAYQNGPSALVATFDYSYLAFSALWGFLFFTEAPGVLTITGMVMIVAAGIIATRQR